MGDLAWAIEATFPVLIEVESDVSARASAVQDYFQTVFATRSEEFEYVRSICVSTADIGNGGAIFVNK